MTVVMTPVCPSEMESREKRLRALHLLIALMPRANRDTLWALLNFLQVIVHHSTSAVDEQGNEVSPAATVPRPRGHASSSLVTPGLSPTSSRGMLPLNPGACAIPTPGLSSMPHPPGQLPPPHPRAISHPTLVHASTPQGFLPPHSGSFWLTLAHSGHPTPGQSPAPLWCMLPPLRAFSDPTLAHSGSFWPPHPRAISHPTLVHASPPQGFLPPHSGSFWLTLAHSGHPTPGQSPAPLWGMLPPLRAGLSPTPLSVILPHRPNEV